MFRSIYVIYVHGFCTPNGRAMLRRHKLKKFLQPDSMASPLMTPSKLTRTTTQSPGVRDAPLTALVEWKARAESLLILPMRKSPRKGRGKLELEDDGEMAPPTRSFPSSDSVVSGRPPGGAHQLYSRPRILSRKIRAPPHTSSGRDPTRGWRRMGTGCSGGFGKSGGERKL